MLLSTRESEFEARFQGAGVVEESGPAEMRATWDAEPIRDAVRGSDPGVSVELSDDAGDFLCNHTFYRVLRVQKRHVLSGVLHVPKVSIVGQPIIDRAVEAAAAALISAARRGQPAA